MGRTSAYEIITECTYVLSIDAWDEHVKGVLERGSYLYTML